MRPSSDAGRAHVDLTRIGLGISDELGNRRCRNRWIHRHDDGRADDARDRRYVADQIVVELVVERRVDGVVGGYQEERIAVGRCTHDRFGADIAAATWAVFYDEWLA